MGSITETSLTIAEIELSPRNVRPHTPAADDLEASIVAVGLKEPVLVHPMLGRKGRFGVFAGGRRCKAIRALVARGALPADWPVPVRLHEGYTELELEEMSLIENVGRHDMEPHEIYAATRKIIARGGSIDQLARLLGRDPGEAKRWLRLGSLAKPVFTALVNRDITDEMARAYAATDDTALQQQVFERLMKLPVWQRSAGLIRGALGFDDAENRRWLAFVGDEAYRSAGGVFELDLFADDAAQRGRVKDAPLLMRLRDAKLEAMRAELRAAAGRPDLRFEKERPRHPDYGGDDHQLRIATAIGAGITPADLPNGDVVCHVSVGNDGAAEVSWWWASRKAKAAATRQRYKPTFADAVRAVREEQAAAVAAKPTPALVAVANQVVKDEAGVSAETTDIFRAIRRMILRAGLVEDARAGGDVARDYLVWGLLRQALLQDSQIGLTDLAPGDVIGEHAQSHVRAMPACREWEAALAELRAAPFMVEENRELALFMFCHASERTRALAAAVVTGLALARSLNEGYRVAVHDEVARACGVDRDAAIRRWWEPTAELLDRIPAKQRLAIAQPFVERFVWGTWQRVKSAELTQHVLDVVTGRATSFRRGMREAAETWVHPLLRFRAADPPQTDAREPVLAEAAE